MLAAKIGGPLQEAVQDKLIMHCGLKHLSGPRKTSSNKLALLCCGAWQHDTQCSYSSQHLCSMLHLQT